MTDTRPAPFAPLLAVAAALAAGPAAAETVYLAPEKFVQEAFVRGPAPEARVLWLTAELRQRAASILGRDPGVPRVKYWAAGTRTAWILEEIGKEEPITTGYVVDAGALRAVRVLVYRESRGWEVREPAFTRQFEGARLDPHDRLSAGIDGISGATLSVNALSRMARLALYYHSQVAA